MVNRIITWCARSAEAITDIGEKELGLVSKARADCRADFWWSGMRWM